jgi:hypothetical protein
VSAGWAAAFIAAIAAYFQVRGAQAADRRLVQAGLPAWQLAAARALTGLALAVVASAAALVTLAARTGIEDPGRVAAGTFMFAVSFSQARPLLIALTWLAAATATAAVVFRRNLRTAGRVTAGRPPQP